MMSVHVYCLKKIALVYPAPSCCCLFATTPAPSTPRHQWQLLSPQHQRPKVADREVTSTKLRHCRRQYHCHNQAGQPAHLARQRRLGCCHGHQNSLRAQTGALRCEATPPLVPAQLPRMLAAKPQEWAAHAGQLPCRAGLPCWVLGIEEGQVHCEPPEQGAGQRALPPPRRTQAPASRRRALRGHQPWSPGQAAAGTAGSALKKQQTQLPLLCPGRGPPAGQRHPTSQRWPPEPLAWLMGRWPHSSQPVSISPLLCPPQRGMLSQRAGTRRLLRRAAQRCAPCRRRRCAGLGQA
jgi:hypothetical protein